MHLFLIKANQLFETLPDIHDDTRFLMIESHHISNQNKYHKQKLYFLFSAMRKYKKFLEEKKYNVSYYTLQDNESLKNKNDFNQRLHEEIEKYKTKTLHIFRDVDPHVEKERIEQCRKWQIDLKVHDSPMFLNNRSEYEKEKYKNAKKLAFMPFYTEQRKKFDILLTTHGSPEGGQWSYDTENRKPLKGDAYLPREEKIKVAKVANDDISTAVETYFTDHPGDIINWLPTTHKDAKEWLHEFLETSLEKFGTYEDAVRKDDFILYHSVLTPMLNAGLITPQEIVEETLSFAKTHNTSLNNLEGFIRQIIGWREYMYLTYLNKHETLLKTNFFAFDRSMPDAFYIGKTGIDPIDQTIKKALHTGYIHHIERLMILGNFMLLCRIKPQDIYLWFLELFVDAYPWVMSPNVMGMSQFGGGIITTKPYISSSQYVLKMSDYKKGDWCHVWDSLYWTFLADYEDKLHNNYRMKFMYNILSKKSSAQMKDYQETANAFLKNLK